MLTGAIIVVGTALVVNGVLVDGAVRLADHVFSLQNEDTEPGVTQPTTGLRSGGPGSLVSWDSLGRYGRSFVAGGPTAAQIGAVRGGGAIPPVRTYAGLDSAAESRTGPASPSTTCSGPAGSPDPYWSSPPPPARAGSTRRHPTRWST